MGAARVRRRCVGGKTVDVEVEVEAGRLRRVVISGDFFAYPEGALEAFEESLSGVEPSRDEVLKVIRKFGIEFLGASAEEIADMIAEAAELAGREGGPG